MTAPAHVLFVVGFDDHGRAVVYVPDDPAASASVSGPTSRTVPLEGLQPVLEALPEAAWKQAASIAGQHLAGLYTAADELDEQAEQARTRAEAASSAVSS